MDALFESVIFWVGVAIFGVVAVYAINRFLGGLAEARSQEQAKYQHRVANELPRELHTKDRDEVLDLKSQKEIEGK